MKSPETISFSDLLENFVEHVGRRVRVNFRPQPLGTTKPGPPSQMTVQTVEGQLFEAGLGFFILRDGTHCREEEVASIEFV